MDPRPTGKLSRPSTPTSRNRRPCAAPRALRLESRTTTVNRPSLTDLVFGITRLSLPGGIWVSPTCDLQNKLTWPDSSACWQAPKQSATLAPTSTVAKIVPCHLSPVPVSSSWREEGTGVPMLTISPLTTSLPFRRSVCRSLCEPPLSSSRGTLGQELSRLLTQIPLDIELGEDGADRHVADGAAADQAWRLLDDQADVGWVTAGKLLARKRPRLIPVYDNVVACVLQWPTGFWLALHAALQEQDRVLQVTLDDIHRDAGLPDAVSRLRVLDVAMWMRHVKQHSGSGCKGT